MNILIVSERLPVLGEAQVVPLTPVALAESGHRVFYISCSTRIPPELCGVRSGHLHANVTLFGRRLPLSSFLNWLHSQRFLSPVYRLLFVLTFLTTSLTSARLICAENRMDLLYGYEVCGVLAVRSLRRKLRVPVVTRFQGVSMYLPYATGWFRRALAFDYTLALRSPGDLTIMTDDGTDGASILRQLASPVRRLAFWRNGVAQPSKEAIERSSQLRRTLGITLAERMLLTVSRLEPSKGVARAICALRGISDAVPGVKLVVVGDGPERESLQRLAHQMGLEDRVLFVGAVEHERVWEFLLACEVFLSLYEHSNLGNPLLEALRCGRCIVTLDNGGTGRVVRDLENGMLVSPSERTIDDVTAAIVRVLKDDNLRKELEAGAARYAEANLWTWEERMAAEVDAINKLVAGHG